MLWTQVGVIVAAMAILVVLAVLVVLSRMDAAFARQRRFLEDNQRRFLASEYTRLAAQGMVYQEELKALIHEVKDVVNVVREAYQDADWDADGRLSRLEEIEEHATAPVFPET